MQRHWSLYLFAFALLPGLSARPAVSQETRPLVELSRPNAVGSCDTGFYTYGDWSVDEAHEPIVAVNPIHPNNVVAAWTQGPFQDIIAAVSLDGDQSWQQVPIPLTVCSGGSFVFTGDPWISFAPNGELYVVAGAGHTLADAGIVVIKSGDGGLHWSAPLMVPGSRTPDPHASLTADPKDARYVYALWHRLFSRTTDGGLTWEPARTIVSERPQTFVQFSQILVLPNGTLLDIYDFRKFPKQQPDKPVISLQVRRSTNQGQTWSAPGKVVRITPLLRANGSPVVDPKTGQFVSDVTNASFAMDRRNGNLYAVWEDGRFSNFQYNDTAFAMSANGGLTWSVPIRVNRTPLDIPPANRQAFFPSIAVAEDGTIGVSYYDFRFNDANPGLPTDRWLVLCHPSSSRPATNPANWGNEVRLTDSSFNMEAVVAKILNMKDRFFIGDYFGLATAGNDFVSVFIQPDHDNVTSTFFRRVKPLNAQQKRTLTPEDVVDIRTVHDANVSPDGKRIAFVVTEPVDSSKPDKPRDDNIWVVPVDGSEPARLFAFSAKSENTPRWSPDGRWLAFLSDRGEDGQNQIWLMHGDGGEAEKLTSAKAGVDSYKWSPDGQMIAFLTRDAKTDEERKKQELHDDAIRIDHDYKFERLWVIGMKDRKQVLVTQQNLEITDFDWSPDSTSFAIAFTSVPGFEELHAHLAIVRRSDGELVRRLADSVNLNGTSSIRWSPDGTMLLFFEGPPKGLASWLSLISLDSGQARPLLKDYSGTFLACEWTPDSKHLIAEAVVDTRVKLLRIDVGSGEMITLADISADILYDLLHNIADFSLSADARTLAFVNEKPDSPGDVWSSTAGQQPRQLTNVNPQIASLKLGNMRDFSWTNRKDGRVLHGVVVTPADFKSGQPLPTIVQAHGGTLAWLSGWQGSWWQWAQLLASNGYVVFLPNSRGVMGQGWELSEIIQSWSEASFEDTMDGVDSLIEQKIADPNRLGIGGLSNGGYMSAWAITHTNRFKAAVPFAAPVDFPMEWGASVIRKTFEAAFDDTPLHARQVYDVHSPFHFVQNCRTPTLILHGETDPVVPIAQAYEFYHALKALGVETEMVVYPREGHNLEERAHQIDFQKRVLGWFENHLK